MFFRNIKSFSAHFPVCPIFRNIATLHFQIFCNYSSHPPWLHCIHWVCFQLFSRGDAGPWSKPAPSWSNIVSRQASWCWNMNDSASPKMNWPKKEEQLQQKKNNTGHYSGLVNNMEKCGYIFFFFSCYRHLQAASEILVLLVSLNHIPPALFLLRFHDIYTQANRRLRLWRTSNLLDKAFWGAVITF